MPDPALRNGNGSPPTHARQRPQPARLSPSTTDMSSRICFPASLPILWHPHALAPFSGGPVCSRHTNVAHVAVPRPVARSASRHGSAPVALRTGYRAPGRLARHGTGLGRESCHASRPSPPLPASKMLLTWHHAMSPRQGELARKSVTWPSSLHHRMDPASPGLPNQAARAPGDWLGGGPGG